MAEPFNQFLYGRFVPLVGHEHHIAIQKHPERLELVDVLPTTASGKVQKFLLRQEIAARLAAER